MFRPLRSLFLFLAIFFFAEISYSQNYSLSPKDTSEVRFVNSRKFFIYKVEKGETIFSISKKFNIPQEEIHQFNPDLETKGLKTKMKLWIPAYSWLNLPGKKPNATDDNLVDTLSAEKNNTVFRVAVFTSLQLSKIYLAGSENDSNYIEETPDQLLLENLDFIQGMHLAAAEHANPNSPIALTVYDIDEDSIKLEKLLLQKELPGLNCIVSNLQNPYLNRLNIFSKQYNIPLLSAGVNSTEIIKSNPKAFAVTPSSVKQCELMGEKMAEIFKNSHVLLINTGVNREEERSLAFKTGWMKDAKTSRIRMVKASNKKTQNLLDSLHRTRNNLIFIPTSNEDLVSTLLFALRDAGKDYKITVVGLPTWQYFTTIDGSLLEELNTHLFTASSLNAVSPAKEQFRKKYREEYQGEPREAAYLGFDMMGLSENLFNKKMRLKYEKIKTGKEFEGLYSNYNFIQTEEDSCRENTVIFLYKFKDNILVPCATDQVPE